MFWYFHTAVLSWPQTSGAKQNYWEGWRSDKKELEGLERLCCKLLEKRNRKYSYPRSGVRMGQELRVVLCDTMEGIHPGPVQKAPLGNQWDEAKDTDHGRIRGINTLRRPLRNEEALQTKQTYRKSRLTRLSSLGWCIISLFVSWGDLYNCASKTTVGCTYANEREWICVQRRRLHHIRT